MEQQTKHTPELRIHGDYSEIHPIFDEDGLIIIADIDPEKSLSYDQKKKYAELFAEAPTTAAERDKLKKQVDVLAQDCSYLELERDKLKEEVERLNELHQRYFDKFNETNDSLRDINKSLIEALEWSGITNKAFKELISKAKALNP